MQPCLVIQGSSAAVHRLCEHEPRRTWFIGRINGASVTSTDVASTRASGGRIDSVHAADTRGRIKRAAIGELQR